MEANMKNLLIISQKNGQLVFIERDDEPTPFNLTRFLMHQDPIAVRGCTCCPVIHSHICFTNTTIKLVTVLEMMGINSQEKIDIINASPKNENEIWEYIKRRNGEYVFTHSKLKLDEEEPEIFTDFNFNKFQN